MWTDIDTAIAIIAILASLLCSHVGTWLVVSRRAMTVDAISHSVLPGVVLSYMLTSSVEGSLIGGGITGFIAPQLSNFTERLLPRGASIGLVYTSFFSLGLLLINLVPTTIDLDPACVLFGSLEYAALDGGYMRLWLMCVIVIGISILFWRPFLQIIFDPVYARLSGERVGRLGVILQLMVAFVAIASFEVIGTVMTLAFMVIPASTAILLSSSLKVVFLMSGILSVCAAISGHILAITLPSLYSGASLNSASMMSICSFVFFIAAFALSSFREKTGGGLLD